MGISITDLPLNMQKQALRKLAEEEATVHPIQEETKVISKYHAKKVTLTLNDGSDHTFDSKHEAEMYQELALRERAGEISDLQIQVPFELIPKQVAPSGKKYRECKYIADFVYKDSNSETIVADAKGLKTKEYIIKKKLMLKVWGIEIKEI